MPIPLAESVVQLDATVELRVRDLGRMAYAPALALQRELHAEVVASRADGDDVPRRMIVLLVEHDPPVITVSRRTSARQNLVATSEMLARAGVEVAETDRGGDITYHGLGQLVVYPILDLNHFGLRLHEYMRLLEQVVIDVLGRFGVEGRRDPSATGVWVGGKRANAQTHKRTNEMRERGDVGAEDVGPPAKICAMGVRVSRWVTMHGLALNVATNLDHFNLIVPCGLIGRGVTSMQRELGGDAPSMNEVKREITEALAAALIRTIRPAD